MITKGLQSSGSDQRSTVALVSDRILISDSLVDILQRRSPDCRFQKIDELHALTATGQPGWVICDLDEPGFEWNDLAVAFAELPGATLVGIYDTFTALHAQRAFDLGVTILVPLSTPVAKISSAILDPATRLSATRAEGLTRSDLRRIASLTARELEVLQLLATECSTDSAARILKLTPHTVQAHRRKALSKLSVHHLPHAISLLVDAGLVVPTDS